jgi:hypothetical protein
MTNHTSRAWIPDRTAGPAPVTDTGSYEVINLGGQAAVVVPVADLLQHPQDYRDP